jgi:hypothetical protein
MTDPQGKPNEPPRRREGLRGHVAGIVALAALAVVVVAWFWTTRQPAPDAGIGLPHGVIVAGAGVFIASLVAEIRSMSLSDVLEAVWELIVGLFSLVGAILKAVWNGLMALLGWD